MYPADRELVSKLICPEAQIDAVQGLEKFNTDVLFQQKVNQDVLRQDCKLPKFV